MKAFHGRTAVITGAASGLGREFARHACGLGMQLVLADVEAAPLNALVAELGSAGCRVLGEVVDVSRSEDVARLAERAYAEFGEVSLLFNNAGVGSGGYLWENSEADWQWVLGVNLWGVVHGIRHFVPRMLTSGQPAHIVNTASVAGLLCAPVMGVYNVSKHAVVALTETLHHDLRMAGAQIGVSLLCPAFVPTGIALSHRNRPADLRGAAPTASQKMAHAAIVKAVDSGRVAAPEVARITFEAIAEDRFYVFTHPQILPSVQLRFDDILAQRTPSDPYLVKPSARPHPGAEPVGG
jgi:NAD(P)-dependent dehydrogenase (short-subunit alcohol dehydrogenase family)